MPRGFWAEGRAEHADASSGVEVMVPAAEAARAAAVLRALAGAEWNAQVEGVLRQRTQSVRVVFDGPGNLSNAWACLRAMDSFGVQYGEVVDQASSDFAWKDSMSSALTSQPWVSMRRWSHAAECVAALRAEGYSVVALDLGQGSSSLEELLPVRAGPSCGFSEKHPPLALVLGNEVDGVSEDMRRLADARGVLPTCGMCQSFNMSVACAVLLTLLRSRGFLHPGNLSSSQRSLLRLRWLAAACDGNAAESALQAAGIPLSPGG